jgi:hypothetical protein
MNDEIEKEAFAREWLRLNDPFKAAIAIVGADAGRALQISNDWIKDADVLKFKAKLIAESGEAAFIPSKEAFALKVFEVAESARHTEDRLKAYRLFGEIMGYIEKPTTNINNNVVTANKVMIVREQVSDDVWEAKLLKQQRELTHVASKH